MDTTDLTCDSCQKTFQYGRGNFGLDLSLVEMRKHHPELTKDRYFVCIPCILKALGVNIEAKDRAHDARSPGTAVPS